MEKYFAAILATLMTFAPVPQVDIVVSPIATSGSASFAIQADGNLWAWGDNFFGQLGDGTRQSGENPVKIMTDAVAVSAGSFTTAAISSDATLWTWGDNRMGQIGDGTRTITERVVAGPPHGTVSTAVTEDNCRLVPTKIMDNVIYVSVGDFHMAAIRADGTLWTWGWNFYGQLLRNNLRSNNFSISIHNEPL